MACGQIVATFGALELIWINKISACTYFGQWQLHWSKRMKGAMYKLHPIYVQCKIQMVASSFRPAVKGHSIFECDFSVFFISRWENVCVCLWFGQLNEDERASLFKRFWRKCCAGGCQCCIEYESAAGQRIEWERLEYTKYQHSICACSAIDDGKFCIRNETKRLARK